MNTAPNLNIFLLLNFFGNIWILNNNKLSQYYTDITGVEFIGLHTPLHFCNYLDGLLCNKTSKNINLKCVAFFLKCVNMKEVQMLVKEGSPQLITVNSKNPMYTNTSTCKYTVNKGMMYLIGQIYTNLFNTYRTVHRSYLISEWTTNNKKSKPLIKL